MAAQTQPVGEERPQVTEPGSGLKEAKPPWRKIVLLAAVVAVLLGVVYCSPLRQYLTHWQELGGYVRGLGWRGPVVLTLSVALLVAAGFPRLVFCVIAGMALGFWSGLLWAQLGTLLGNYLIFLVARWGARGWAQRYLSRHNRLQQLMRQEGVLGVILARQLPVPGLLVNLTCALLSIRHRHFLLGTLLGQLPEAIPCTLIGAGLLKDSFAKSASFISLAVVVAVVVGLAVRLWLRRPQAGLADRGAGRPRPQKRAP